MHIGSQLFDLEPWRLAVEAIATLGDFPAYDLGGGLAVAYTAARRPPTVAEYVSMMRDTADELLGPGKQLSIEPGRALVATAGVTLYSVESVKDVDLADGRVRFVAVDGGMSDNMRPMLYDAPYEADLVDRVGASGTPCTVVGKHCESGDVLIRETTLPEPQVGDVLATPVTGAYVYAMANNYNGVPRPPVVFCTPRQRAARRPPRDLRGPVWARRIGSACSATAPSAPRSSSCSRERAEAVEHITGRRPEVTGVLTRSRGDFEEILANSDLIVELIGGIEPARDYVLRAMKAGKHVVSANKLLLASHGEELWATAREHQVQLRFEGAVAGVVPVIRVLQESLAGAQIERIHGIVNGTTNFILSEMARGGDLLRDALPARAGARATPRPTRPTTSPAATPRPRWRSSPGWRSRRPSTSTR